MIRSVQRQADPQGQTHTHRDRHPHCVTGRTQGQTITRTGIQTDLVNSNTAINRRQVSGVGDGLGT